MTTEEIFEIFVNPLIENGHAFYLRYELQQWTAAFAPVDFNTVASQSRFISNTMHQAIVQAAILANKKCKTIE